MIQINLLLNTCKNQEQIMVFKQAFFKTLLIQLMRIGKKISTTISKGRFKNNYNKKNQLNIFKLKNNKKSQLNTFKLKNSNKTQYKTFKNK